MTDLELLRTCNLCLADDFRVLYGTKDYRLGVDDTEWTVVRCRRCGLGFLNPRPTEAAIGGFYPTEYYDGRGASAKRVRYREQMRHIPVGAGRLLDIGTAGGAFLDLLEERGWRAIGVDRSHANTATGRGRVVQARFPGESPFAAASFDCITSWAVFEHLHDPRAAFQECARLMKPGSTLIIQVPNLRSLSSRFAYQEDVPRHLFFYTQKTLRRFGASAGLELEKVIHTTRIFGGSGRGVGRVWLFRALRRSVDDYFEFLAFSRVQRFAASPVVAALWHTIGLVERLVLADRVAELLRVSGQVVAVYRKPSDTNSRRRISA